MIGASTAVPTTSGGVIGRVRAALTPGKPAPPAFDDVDVDLGEVLDALANQRRRHIVRYLVAHDDGCGITHGELVDHIALAEHDEKTNADILTGRERKAVHVALYQSHLPKLDELGLVDYNQPRGIVDARNGIYAANRILDEAAGVVGGEPA